MLRASLLCDPPLILPAPQIVEQAGGAPLALVQVPPGLPNVYNVQGVYWTRLGAHNRPLTTPELRRLLLDRGEGASEAQPLDGATVDDLDPARVNRYLDRLMLLPAEDATETLLARGCLARDPSGVLRPTVAGMLLFGRAPQQFVRSAEILCVRYAGTAMGDEFVRQEIGGALPDQIRQAEAFVAANMRRGQRIGGLERGETAEYPLPVVREAIVNAVAHRDYSRARRGHPPAAVQRPARTLLAGAAAGPCHAGQPDGRALQPQRGHRRPAQRPGLHRAAGLRHRPHVRRAARGGPARPHLCRDGGGLPGNAALRPRWTQPRPSLRRRLAVPGLNERQERALAYVREHGRITNSDLQEMAPDVSAETIRRDLADLVEKTLLLRIGSKRATYYILK